MDLSNLEPEGQYRLTLVKKAYMGTTLMRPRDQHIVKGSAATTIDPQDAVTAAERVN